MSIEKAYDHWSEQYDTNKNRTRDLDKIATQTVLAHLDFDNVLELGCGTGKNTQWLIEKTKKILSIDFSENMLNIAREKIKSQKVEFRKADITKQWSWAQQEFELITCNLILEHISELEPVFEKASSQLNSGGHFFVSELHPFKQYKGTKARFESKNGRIELETYTHHISDFTTAAKKAGFIIDRIDEWFDEDQRHTPRLISFLFQKS